MTLHPGIDAETIATAAQMLESGRLVAFPTETVYGLGADAENPVAVQQIFALKGRPADRPLSVNISKDTDITYWVSEIPASARKLMDAFWPGPLTLVLKKSVNVPDTISRGKGSVALRCPAHPFAIALLKVFKQGRGGIAAPSANRSGHISPTTAQHVRDEFGTDERLGMILDGGSCDLGIESTILDLSRLETVGPVILRPGVITAGQIAEVIGRLPVINAPLSDTGIKQTEPHYAPKTPAFVLSISEIQQILTLESLKKVALLLHTDAFAEKLVGYHPQLMVRHLPDTPSGYAQQLYAVLRELDDHDIDVILIETVPQDQAWNAVRNRIGGVAEAGLQLKAKLFPSLKC
ncbi:MAG: threonylcarbamoyl-AMP synthase [Oxalobacter sp.]|nr:threonylcarbamoyl-AMP synthase [Oxalobacter sp.]